MVKNFHITCFATHNIHKGSMKNFADEGILLQKLNDLSEAIYLLQSVGTVAPSSVFFLLLCIFRELSWSFKPDLLYKMAFFFD